MLKTILAMTLVMLTAPASAQVLWQNLHVGMTADEIRVAQPSATPPPTPHTLRDATCALWIQGYEVQGNRFDVCFFLRDGHLMQVMMSANSPSQAEFESMAVLLRGRYGSEMNPGGAPCRHIGSMTSCGIDWLLPTGVNVNIVYMEMGDRNPLPLLNINYQIRIRAESDRL